MFVKNQESFEAKCRGYLLSIFSLVTVPFLRKNMEQFQKNLLGHPS